MSLFDDEPIQVAQDPEVITATGDQISAVSPEGEQRTMKIEEFLERVAPRQFDTGEIVLPDGVKCVQPVPGGAVVVHQTPPRVHRFKWIAADSPAPFGPETTYREVSIALPYITVIAVFDEVSRNGALRLANSSECFFTNHPLENQGLDTPLAFPALLNCSRFPDSARARPLSWICVEKLPRSARVGLKTAHEGVQKGLTALLQHLLESGFNRSSDEHEMSSWYSETVKADIDPRLATIEDWERASEEDPLFVLEMPWLPTNHTVRSAIARIAKTRGADRGRLSCTRDLLRVLFQQRPKAKKQPGDQDS